MNISYSSLDLFLDNEFLINETLILSDIHPNGDKINELKESLLEQINE